MTMPRGVISRPRAASVTNHSSSSSTASGSGSIRRAAKPPVNLRKKRKSAANKSPSNIKTGTPSRTSKDITRENQCAPSQKPRSRSCESRCSKLNPESSPRGRVIQKGSRTQLPARRGCSSSPSRTQLHVSCFLHHGLTKEVEVVENAGKLFQPHVVTKTVQLVTTDHRQEIAAGSRPATVGCNSSTSDFCDASLDQRAPSKSKPFRGMRRHRDAHDSDSSSVKKIPKNIVQSIKSKYQSYLSSQRGDSKPSSTRHIEPFSSQTASTRTIGLSQGFRNSEDGTNSAIDNSISSSKDVHVKKSMGKNPASRTTSCVQTPPGQKPPEIHDFDYVISRVLGDVTSLTRDMTSPVPDALPRTTQAKETQDNVVFGRCESGRGYKKDSLKRGSFRFDSAEDVQEVLRQCEEHTTWVNELLRHHSCKPITDLRKSVSDGLTVVNVLEIIANEKLSGAQDKPVVRSQKVDNIRHCISFLESKGVDVQGLSPEELTDGNLKSTLLLMNNIRKKYDAQYTQRELADGAAQPPQVASRPNSARGPDGGLLNGHGPARLNNTRTGTGWRSQPSLGSVGGGGSYQDPSDLLPGTLGADTPQPHPHITPTFTPANTFMSIELDGDRTSKFHPSYGGTTPLTPRELPRGMDSGPPPSKAAQAWGMDASPLPNGRSKTGMMASKSNTPTSADPQRLKLQPPPLRVVPPLITPQPRTLQANTVTQPYAEGELLIPPRPRIDSATERGHENGGLEPDYSYVPSQPADRRPLGSRGEALLDKYLSGKLSPGVHSGNYRSNAPPSAPPQYFPPPQYNRQVATELVSNGYRNHEMGENTSSVERNDLRNTYNKLYSHPAPAQATVSNSYSSPGLGIKSSHNPAVTSQRSMAAAPRSSPMGQSSSSPPSDPSSFSRPPGHKHPSDGGGGGSGGGQGGAGAESRESHHPHLHPHIARGSSPTKDAGETRLHAGSDPRLGIRGPPNGSDLRLNTDPGHDRRPSPREIPVNPRSRSPPPSASNNQGRIHNDVHSAETVYNGEHRNTPNFSQRQDNNVAVKYNQQLPSSQPPPPPQRTTIPGDRLYPTGFPGHPGTSPREGVARGGGRSTSPHHTYMNTATPGRHKPPFAPTDMLASPGSWRSSVASEDSSMTPPLPPLSPSNTPPLTPPPQTSAYPHPAPSHPHMSTRAGPSPTAGPPDVVAGVGRPGGRRSRRSGVGVRTFAGHQKRAPPGRASYRGAATRPGLGHNVEEDELAESQSGDDDDDDGGSDDDRGSTTNCETETDATNAADSQDVRHMRRQMEGLEVMYGEVLRLLGPDREYLPGSRRSISSMSSVSRTQPGRKSRHQRSGHRHRKEIRQVNKRFARLESHVVTLARSVAHLSSEMRSQNALFTEMEDIKKDIRAMKRERHAQAAQAAQAVPQAGPSAGPGQPPAGSTLTQHEWDQFRGWIPAISNPKRVQKLAKFFGKDRLLHYFLEKLGYQKYIRCFEQEEITILELPYMNEERLKKLGLPMGPRQRILQEAQLCFRQENFNIYIV